MGKINVTSMRKGNIKANRATCTVCKNDDILTLKRNFVSLRTHYIIKDKIRFTCKGSKKLHLEARKKLLSGDINI